MISLNIMTNFLDPLCTLIAKTTTTTTATIANSCKLNRACKIYA